MSPVLPREERDAIRARAEAATPGPWRTWNDGHVGSPTVHIGGCVMPTPGSDPAQRMPDAEFIAHARTDMPALLDALDGAEAENEQHALANGGCVPADAYRDLAEHVAALRGRIEALATDVAKWHGREHDRVFTNRAGPEVRDALRRVHDRLRALAADEGERAGR